MGHAKEFLRCPRCRDRVWFIRHDHPTLTPPILQCLNCNTQFPADWPPKVEFVDWKPDPSLKKGG